MAAPRRHGEQYLDGVAAIRLKLEGRSKPVEFRIADELAVPDDPLGRQEAALEAASRLAFWSYQTVRARRAWRDSEREYAALAGEEYVVQRIHIHEHTIDEPTEPHVRARVDRNRELKVERMRADATEEHYRTLDALTRALEHRSHTLRRYAAQPNGAHAT